MSLVGNLPRTEFERRLALLGIQHDEIVKLGKKKSLPLFDQLALHTSDHPTVYEEVSEINSEIQDEEDEIHQMGTHQDPEWLQDVLQGQQDANNNIADALAALATAIAGQNNNNLNSKPLRMEDVYEFKPTSSRDDIDYFLFVERIGDLVGQYGDNHVRPALLSCLRNARSKQWYTSLSDADKTSLAQNCENWKVMLKRDFGIPSSRARILVQQETFSFSQNRPILLYYNTKLAWLKIAEVHDENQQCVEIREGLQDPEYRTAIRLTHGNNTLQWLRAELQETEADIRALWQKTNIRQPSRDNVRQSSPLRGRPNPRQRGYRGQFRGTVSGTRQVGPGSVASKTRLSVKTSC